MKCAGSPTLYECIHYYRCPFYGVAKPKRASDRVRKIYKPPQIFGCTATLVSRLLYTEDKVAVQYTTQHQGHRVNSLDDWQRLRMSSRLRKWPQRVFEAGLNYNAIKKSTRPNE